VTDRLAYNEKGSKDLVFFTDLKFDKNIEKFLMELSICKSIKEVKELIPHCTLVLQHNILRLKNIDLRDCLTKDGYLDLKKQSTLGLTKVFEIKLVKVITQEEAAKKVAPPRVKAECAIESAETKSSTNSNVLTRNRLRAFNKQ